MTYRITIDREACEGIFACLVRDDRFVEGEEGLATLAGDAGDDRAVRHDGETIVGEFEEDIERAREAAAACPPGAITVTEHPEDDRCP